MNVITDRSTLAKNPAYKEYPADILNNEIFMQMNMAQRGLYWTLRMFCWRNGTVSYSWEELSRLLGIKREALEKLTADGNVEKFFKPTDDLKRMYCPDIEAYRNELLEKAKKREEAGRKAAEKQLRDRRNGNAQTGDMGTDMNSTDYDGTMNGYLVRALN
jgi:hypothetical protein